MAFLTNCTSYLKEMIIKVKQGNLSNCRFGQIFPIDSLISQMTDDELEKYVDFACNYKRPAIPINSSSYTDTVDVYGEYNNNSTSEHVTSSQCSVSR